MEIIISIVSGLFGSAVTFGVIKWTGNLVSKKFIIKWQKNSNQEIEKLKAESNIRNDLLKTTLDSFSSGNTYVQEKKIDSIEELWKSTLYIKEKISPLITFYGVLLPEEYNQASIEKGENFKIDKISYSTIIEMSKEIDSIEKLRPFLGEYIWSLYHLYFSFIGRVMFLFRKQCDENNIKPWYTDDHLKEIAMEISKDTIAIDLEQIDGFQFVLNIFQHKLIKEIDDLISGKKALNSNMEEARRLMLFSRELETEIYDGKVVKIKQDNSRTLSK